jgi:hypothetical protein
VMRQKIATILLLSLLLQVSLGVTGCVKQNDNDYQQPDPAPIQTNNQNLFTVESDEWINNSTRIVVVREKVSSLRYIMVTFNNLPVTFEQLPTPITIEKGGGE